MERYFLEPYRFVPPYRGTRWCRLLGPAVMRRLGRRLGLRRWQIDGAALLRESLARGAGVLLAPNHCRWADVVLLGLLSREAGKYFYFLASYHLFCQGRLSRWLTNRLGGYSIWREGLDREALKTTARLLADAERPVVFFPEGTWFRQNDRVAPLQDGLVLITRQAARLSDRPLVVHPVGIKYWLLEDPAREARRRLERLERRLGWSPQDQLPLLPRIEKLGGALLALKEIEFLGAPQTGDLDGRIARLVEARVERLERQHLGRCFDGWALERIRRLRQQLTRQLHAAPGDGERAGRCKGELEELLLLENLNAHSLEYLRADPSPERLAETVERIEETISDQVEVPLGRLGACVQVGPGLDARTAASEHKDGDALVGRLRRALQGLIDGLRQQGPPLGWPHFPRSPATDKDHHA